MTSIPVYMVVNLKVTDADEYRKYEKGFFPLLKKYGGTFLTYDDNVTNLEGVAQAAKDWWADADYQTLSEFRRAGTHMEFLTMVHGLPPRD